MSIYNVQLYTVRPWQSCKFTASYIVRHGSNKHGCDMKFAVCRLCETVNLRHEAHEKKKCHQRRFFGWLADMGQSCSHTVRWSSHISEFSTTFHTVRHRTTIMTKTIDIGTLFSWWLSLIKNKNKNCSFYTKKTPLGWSWRLQTAVLRLGVLDLLYAGSQQLVLQQSRVRQAVGWGQGERERKSDQDVKVIKFKHRDLSAISDLFQLLKIR